MRARLVNEEFDNCKVIGPEKIVENFELERCTFVGSAAIQWDDPVPTLVIRCIEAVKCTLDNCSVAGTRLEDITIDDLRIKGGMLYLTGCVLSRVTLRGKIGSLMAIPPRPGLGKELSPRASQAIVEAYKSVDWALDISKAEFTDASFDFVPGELIKRDPETQFLLRRERIAEVEPGRFPEATRSLLERFERTPFDSIVLVAPKRSRQFQELLGLFQSLREAGLAE